MKGHVVRKGKSYLVVVDLGLQAAQRCQECGARSWVKREPATTCAKCGGDRFELVRERRRVGHGSYPRMKDAQRALAEISHRRMVGMYVEPTQQTISQYLVDEWLPAIRPTVRASTFASYAGHVRNHVVPHLGSILLADLTAGALNAFYGVLAASGARQDGGKGALAPATIVRVHATMHRALRDAVRWQRLPRNVADSADPPKQGQTDEIQTWTAAQLRDFLAHVRGERLYPLWVLLASTGARKGESLGLRWRDVELDEARLRVIQTYISVGNVAQFSEPKTKRSRRTIELDEKTVATLRAWKAAQLGEQIAAGRPEGWNEHGLVFTREDGAPIHPDAAQSAFERVVATSGLLRLTMHGLRHTHCTLLLAAGENPKVVSERLGHASVAFTLQRYGHVCETMQQDAAKRWAAVLSG